MEPVYVIGTGMTPFGRLEDSGLDLAVKAALEAMNDSETLDSKFDHLVIGTQNPDEFIGTGHLSTLLADRLGIIPVGATRVETGPSSGSSAFELAFSKIAAGLAELVLVIGVEKMSAVDTGTASRILAKMMSYENETQYGATPTALAAMITRRYMHDFGLTRDELSLVPVKAHRNGAKNPLAHFQKEVNVEKVNNSRIVADPLTLYDCCPTSDGASALVRLCLDVDHIHFIVGQGVNPAHQNPDLPRQLGMKLAIVREIAEELRRRGKEVTIETV